MSPGSLQNHSTSVNKYIHLQCPSPPVQYEPLIVDFFYTHSKSWIPERSDNFHAVFYMISIPALTCFLQTVRTHCTEQNSWPTAWSSKHAWSRFPLSGPVRRHELEGYLSSHNFGSKQPLHLHQSELECLYARQSDWPSMTNCNHRYNVRPWEASRAELWR